MGWRGPTIEGAASSAENPVGNDADNSGILRFVRIAATMDHLGESSSDALSLTGVGTGTTIRLSDGSLVTVVNAVLDAPARWALFIDDETTPVSTGLTSLHHLVAYAMIDNIAVTLDESYDETELTECPFLADVWAVDPILSGHLPASGSPALDPALADLAVTIYLGAFAQDDWVVGLVEGL